MQLSPDSSHGFFVQSYGTDVITIASDDPEAQSLCGVYRQTILLSPTLLQPWSIVLADLTMADCEAITQYKPEVFIFGTGAKLVRPAAKIISDLMQRGIGVEVMDTPAACRTFNLLAAEQRKVLAGLIIN